MGHFQLPAVASRSGRKRHVRGDKGAKAVRVHSIDGYRCTAWNDQIVPGYARVTNILSAQGIEQTVDL